MRRSSSGSSPSRMEIPDDGSQTLAPATDEAAPLGEVRVNEKGEREKVDARHHRVARLAHETLRTAAGLAYFGKTYFEVTEWGVERGSCPHRAILRFTPRNSPIRR